MIDRRHGVAFQCPLSVLAGGAAAGRHAWGVGRHRDPPQQCAATGRPCPSGAGIGEPSRHRTRSADHQNRLGARPICRYRVGGHAAAVRQAGRCGGYESGPWAGLVVTLQDAQRDANGRFPRDASPDDLVVHQQDIEAVLNALWNAGAEAIQMQDQRIIAMSIARCVGNTLLLNGRTYSPPYTIAAIGDAAAMQAALAAAPLVTLYKQYVVRFGLGYREEVHPDLQIVGYADPVRMHFAQPAGPLDY